jgi:hypothetical protein
MKHILVFITLYLANLSFGQVITLEHTDYLQAGDTARLSQATDANIDYATTGPNAVWDFTYLQAETQTLLNPFFLKKDIIIDKYEFPPLAPVEYILTNCSNVPVYGRNLYPGR